MFGATGIIPEIISFLCLECVFQNIFFGGRGNGASECFSSKLILKVGVIHTHNSKLSLLMEECMGPWE